MTARMVPVLVELVVCESTGVGVAAAGAVLVGCGVAVSCGVAVGREVTVGREVMVGRGDAVACPVGLALGNGVLVDSAPVVAVDAWRSTATLISRVPVAALGARAIPTTTHQNIVAVTPATASSQSLRAPFPDLWKLT